jgi:hypothetical protein
VDAVIVGACVEGGGGGGFVPGPCPGTPPGPTGVSGPLEEPHPEPITTTNETAKE